jgi:hypothetical protein
MKNYPNAVIWSQEFKAKYLAILCLYLLLIHVVPPKTSHLVGLIQTEE